MRPDARNWMSIAEQASAIVGDPAQGEKEAALAAASRDLDVAPKTLRTYLLAWRFVASLEESLRVQAGAIPAVAVETIARWHRYDPDGALSAFRKVARRELSVRKLLAEEVAARQPRSDLGGRRLELVYRKEIIDERLNELRAVWPPKPRYNLFFDEDMGVRLPNPTGKADLVKPLRYMTEKYDRDGKPIGGPIEGKLGCAIVIIGPYQAAELYKRRAMDWCLRALGLTFFHGHVALVLPGAAARRHFIEMLEMTARGDAERRITLLMDLGRRRYWKLHRQYSVTE